MADHMTIAQAHDRLEMRLEFRTLYGAARVQSFVEISNRRSPMDSGDEGQMQEKSVFVE